MVGWLTSWLSGLSLLALASFVLASMLLASLAGYAVRQLRRRLAPEREASEHSQESYLIGGMLGVLALLLAFSFSMAVERYEERRHLVVQEANAIGTSYLRAQLLDEPHRSRLSQLLVEYTDNRITLGTTKGDAVRRQLAINDQLLTQIWAAVTAARDSAQARGISVPVLATYNELIDLDTERKVARLVRVPAPVLLLMYAFLIVTATVLGFVLEERRAWFGACVLFFLLSIYVSIIADLNRPVSGNIQESQEPMLMLKESLLKQPPAVFDRFKARLDTADAR
jgi:hypothetical protein